MRVITKTKDFYFRHEHYFSPVVLLAGYIFDNLTLRRIDLLIDNLIIIIYLLIAFVSIFYLTVFENRRFAHRFLVGVAAVVPFVLQFTFGGLFSAFLIFYSRSASVIVSWPFLLILAGFLIGNELFRKRYSRFVFRLTIFFVALFSYSVFAVPIVLRRINEWIFLISGFVSLFLFILFTCIISRAVPEIFKGSKKRLAVCVSVVYLLFNLLYFLNIIPPIPLSLTGAGIYHNIVRVGNDYEVQYEESEWYKFWRNESEIFYWKEGLPVYSFSAIFAPTRINTKIYHLWFFYNEDVSEWEEQSKLGFDIIGGRDGGYRGYTMKYGVWPGKWRVDVINERGQILGRTEFIIEKGEPDKLETAIK